MIGVDISERLGIGGAQDGCGESQSKAVVKGGGIVVNCSTKWLGAGLQTNTECLDQEKECFGCFWASSVRSIIAQVRGLLSG